jgi:hypothetical protein
MASLLVVALLLLTPAGSSATAPAPATTIAAGDPLVRWVGRTVGTPDGPVFFDWEGVSASVNVKDYTWLTVAIKDDCPGSGAGGGSRWAVTMTTSDTRAAAADHRIQTFYSAQRVSEYVMFNLPGGWRSCNPACNHPGENTTRFTLTRLTESRLSGCTATQNLSVVSFSSDGVFSASPPSRPAPPMPSPQPVRRLEFIGDSISAGDLDDGGEYHGGAPDTVCGNSAFNDDILFSTGGVLCSYALGFNADCMYTAWGGIQLGGMVVGGKPHWGMSELYPWTFSSDGPSAYGAWNFSAFAADAVVINLGTNGGMNLNRTNDDEAWRDAYVKFATDVS